MQCCIVFSRCAVLQGHFTPVDILAQQPVVTAVMRENLLLWVFEAVCVARMNQETCMLTTNYIDR